MVSSQVFSNNGPKYENDNQESRRVFFIKYIPQVLLGICLPNESDIIANQPDNPGMGESVDDIQATKYKRINSIYVVSDTPQSTFHT